MALELYDHRLRREVVDFYDNVWRSLFGRSLDRQNEGDLFTIDQTYIAPGGMFLLWRKEQKIASGLGFQVYQPGADIVHLRRWYGDPEYRGRGMSVRLLREGIARVWSNPKWNVIRLWTKPGKISEEARKIYLRQGFVVVPEFPIPEARGKVCMELKRKV